MVTQRRDAQRNRAHLLELAQRMVKQGHSDLSLNALAAEAGVGVGTVYRHFEDPRALRLALVERQLGELEALMAAAHAEPNALRAVERLLENGVRLQLENPILNQVLGSPQAPPPRLANRMRALERDTELVLARARRARVIRKDVRAADVRRLACGIVYAARAGALPAQATQRYLEILLAGLRFDA